MTIKVYRSMSAGFQREEEEERFTRVFLQIAFASATRLYLCSPLANPISQARRTLLLHWFHSRLLPAVRCYRLVLSNRVSVRIHRMPLTGHLTAMLYTVRQTFDRTSLLNMHRLLCMHFHCRITCVSKFLSRYIWTIFMCMCMCLLREFNLMFF